MTIEMRRDTVIVVTGAGSGIGRAVVSELTRRGIVEIAAVDLRADWLSDLLTEFASTEVHISTHVVDIGVPEQVSALPEHVIACHGHVDALVNVAGINQLVLLSQDLPAENLHRVARVNFAGTAHVITAFLPLLLTRRRAQITTVASVQALMPYRYSAVYGATKAGITAFVEGLRLELRGTRVGANLVFPGTVRTNIQRHSGGPDVSLDDWPNWVASPEAVAKVIADSLETGRHRVVIGHDAHLITALSKCAVPPFVAHRIWFAWEHLIGRFSAVLQSGAK
ncbi:MAG: SDR family NAD(P)-dependent oxidoreductase [Microbacteriaceae bacterium]